MIGQRILQLTRDSVVYGLGGALTSFIGVALVPVLTRLLAPAEFGVLDLLTTAVLLGTVVFSVGLDSATAILFFESDDPERRRTILGSATLFTAGLAAVVGVLLLPFAAALSALVFHTTAFAPAVRYTLGTVPFLLLFSFALGALRYRFARGRYLTGVATNVALTITVTVLFLLPFRLGVNGYFAAWLLVAAVSSTVALLLAGPAIHLGLSRTVLRDLLRIGLPLLPAGLAGWSLSLIDRFFLSAFSLETLGWYSLGVKIASVLGLAVAALQLAWGPFALALARQPEARQTYARVLTLFTIGAGLLALTVTAYAPELIALVSGPAYAPAAGVVGLLSAGLVAYGAYYIVSIGVNVAKQTAHISWTTAVAAATNIALNFILIPRFGMYGASVATLIAYLLSATLLFRVAQRVYPIPYEGGKVLKTFGLVLLGIGVYAALPPTPTLVLAFMKLIPLALFAVLLQLLGVVRRSELATFGASLRTVLQPREPR